MHRFLSIFLCVIAAASAWAQIPAQMPRVPQPAAPGKDDMVKNLQFPNADVRDVFNLYEKLTNKKLVYDNTVQGNVNIVINTPVTHDEAIKIIEINLLLNGFTLVPDGPDILKVLGNTKNPRVAGIPIYSDLDQIPDGDHVITFLFKLQYADPQEFVQTVGQYISTSPSLYTSIIAVPKSQMLLVTENTVVIRNFAKLVREADIPPAEVVSEFITLERADAKDVIEKLEKIFEKTQTPGGANINLPGGGNITTRPQINPQGQPVANDAANLSVEINGGGLSEESIIIGKIKLTADIRTNRIHVITRPINLPFVRRLIQEFDSDIPFAEPAKRALKFVSASDVLDIVVKAITEPGVKAEESTTGGQKAATPNNPAGQNYAGGFGNGSSTGGQFNISEQLSTQPVDTTPKAVTIGNTKIIADPRENTIIVLGNKQVQQKVFRLLDEIDVRAPQVTLNTVIGELTLNDDKQFGIDYLLHPPGSNATTTGSNGGVSLANLARRFATTQFTGTPLVGSAANALGANTSGLTAAIGATDSLDIIVHALQSTNRFRITQRPMVFTSNNKKAIIASGQQIAVPTQTLSNVANGTTVNNNTAAVSSSVDYKDVTLQLEVVPLINSDREVNLDILQKLDSIVPNADRNVGGTQVPTISTRYIKTNVSVANRATVVLGGLITRTNGGSSAGLPVLSKIPILGYLFKDTSKQNDLTELIVLIRPVVSNSPYETVDNSQAEQQRLLIEPDVESTITGANPDAKPKTKPVKFR